MDRHDALDPAASLEAAHLRFSDLMQVILERVESLIVADTAVILLLDRDGAQLVAHAARGLDDEVHQGVRVPVGAGFAGRIALTRSPMTLYDVGPDTVTNPILWKQGVRSMLGVPLIDDGRLLGVMHVGTREPREFGPEEIESLECEAERVAAVVSAHQRLAERLTARTLQESLLPGRLPEIEGLQFAARFVPAENIGVGGDWFDVFRLPDGRVGIVVGDVAGSGLRAAIVMGRLRSALRAYAFESTTPGEALARLGRKFAHFEPGEFATVLYMTIAPDRASITWSSTGHLPPVMAVPGHDAAILDCSPNPPIGVPVAGRHADAVQELVPGTTVACFTDGLVERRHEVIDVGLDRLRAAFFAGHPEEVCSTVMEELIGSTRVEDDTALLVFRRTT